MNFATPCPAPGFFKANQNSDEHTIRSNFSQLCSNYSSTYSDYTLSTVSTQTSDAIVSAWRDCAVKQNGLYSAIHSIPDSEAFVIEVSYRSDATPRPPLIVRSTSNGEGYRCTINSKEIANLNVTEGGTSGLFSIDCKKLIEQSVIVAINTNHGNIGPFTLGSRLLAIVNNRVDNLSKELTDTRKELTRLSDNVAALKTVYVTVDKDIGSGGAEAHDTLTCPSNSFAVAGGSQWISGGPAAIYQRESYPSDDRRKWTISVGNLAGSERAAARVRFFTVCYGQGS